MDASRRDNETYWVERHEKLKSKLAAVGDISRSQDENLELYAVKKRRMAELLRTLGQTNLSGRSVLDAGCGVGMVSELFFILGADVSGVDASPIAIDEAEHRCPGGDFRIGSLLDFEFQAQFDLSCCIDVLYHVVDDENWRLALRNLARHTRPGGHIVILDQLRAEPHSPAPHVMFRTKDLYDRALTALGAADATPGDQGAFIVYRMG